MVEDIWFRRSACTIFYSGLRTPWCCVAKDNEMRSTEGGAHGSRKDTTCDLVRRRAVPVGWHVDSIGKCHLQSVEVDAQGTCTRIHACREIRSLALRSGICALLVTVLLQEFPEHDVARAT